MNMSLRSCLLLALMGSLLVSCSLQKAFQSKSCGEDKLHRAMNKAMKIVLEE